MIREVDPVVIVLPLGQPQFQVNAVRIRDRPEFLSIGLLGALHFFAIQMR